MCSLNSLKLADCKTPTVSGFGSDLVFSLFCCAVRVKNMFLFDEEQAEKQFHYRTVMINWLYTPGITYKELAEESNDLWQQYLNHESVDGHGDKDPSESWSTWYAVGWRWERGGRERDRDLYSMANCVHPIYVFLFCFLVRRAQIQQALSYLTSEAMLNKKVQFIVETQLLLSPYVTIITTPKINRRHDLTHFIVHYHHNKIRHHLIIILTRPPLPPQPNYSITFVTLHISTIVGISWAVKKCTWCTRFAEQKTRRNFHKISWSMTIPRRVHLKKCKPML